MHLCCFSLRDMRISNIMEHRPDAKLVLPKGFKSKAKQFKLPGEPFLSAQGQSPMNMCSPLLLR